MSSSKGSSKTSSQQTQNFSSSGTQTPNNLPFLQQGWNIADNLFNATNPQGPGLVQNGMDLAGTGANATSTAATGGLRSALNLANGTADGANAYLTPFANGSLSGNNPSFQAVLDQFARGAQSATDGNFAASGRYGSGANANAFNSAVANEAGQLGYQNYTDSLTRQLEAAGQIGNNATSALSLIPGLGSAATGAGGAAIEAGNSPAITFAQIMQALGSGGGTTSQAGSSSGTANSKGSTTSSGFDLSKMFSFAPIPW